MVGKPVDLYYLPGSAPCRSILMVARAVGVKLNLKKTALDKGEHLTPEFLKMNPQHCIPTMDDNGFYLWESRAILTYLVNQYAKDDKLYPKDPKKRALVDQRLYFDMGTLYQRYADYYYPQFFMNQDADPAKYKRLEEGFEFLEKFLEGSDYVAGSSITIADYAVVASITTAEVSHFDLKKYPTVQKYLERVKKEIVDYEELNGAGAREFAANYVKPKA